MLSTHESQDRTLRFLCEAATQYALLAPPVSRSLCRRLRNVARDAKVALHPTTEQLFCSGCSQVYIPGSNCRVSVQPLRKRKRTRKKPLKAERRAKPTKTGWTPGPKAKAEPEKPKRCVQYSCQWCGHRRRMRLPRRRAPRAAAAPTSFQSLNQKKQAAASQEARDAARAAKRQREAKAKAKAASAPQPSGARSLMQVPEPKAVAKAATQVPEPKAAAKAVSQVPEPKSVAKAATHAEAEQPRRKRKREDKMSRALAHLNQRDGNGF
ncbi:unnamed protein product [Effrenium voratum]|nr:unnamed protein product [Effrenium voratum]